MKKIKLIFVISIIVFSISFCTRVPITGRGQLKLQPEKDMVEMALQQYNNQLRNNTVIRGTKEAEMVKQVGSRIAKAANNITMSKAAVKRISKYNWEYTLLDDEIANANCLPGGKITVYSGILPITQTEAGLAAVMAHEVAHAIAQHGNERISQVKLMQFSSVALRAATGRKTPEVQQLYQVAFCIGADLGVLLPFSRLQETEADRIGMILMAKAGYDPHEFIDFFERMKANSPGRQHSFFSTHPTNEKRIQNQKGFLKEALKYYHN